jgi:hypothetical protein
MESGYTVVSKNKRRRSRRKVQPIVVEDDHYERGEGSSSSSSSSSSFSSISDNSYYTFGDPAIIHKCVQERWKNDIEYAESVNTKLKYSRPPPGLNSPIKFFKDSKTARLFKIAQQHPDEYIPVPSMQPYLVPLYPDKEFYNGNGFIPSDFLTTKH